MSFTVVPLHNLRLDVGTVVPFGGGYALTDVPAWFRADSFLKGLGYSDRDSILVARHALVAEYPAAAIGELDPTWKEEPPKSIQDIKFQSAILANLALWLIHPSMVCFTNAYHVISWVVPGEDAPEPVLQKVEGHAPLYCHPREVRNRISPHDVVRAAELHGVLLSLSRNNPLWEGLRACWAGLTMASADRRYPFFWVGLESLFGPNDPSETTHKLCQRIAFFLGQHADMTRDLFRMAKRCYNTRSKIVHGRWQHDPKIDDVMFDSEALIRTALRDILADQALIKTFSSNQRDPYLEDLVFSRPLAWTR